MFEKKKLQTFSKVAVAFGCVALKEANNSKSLYILLKLSSRTYMFIGVSLTRTHNDRTERFIENDTILF